MGRSNVNWIVGNSTERYSTYTSKVVKAGIPFALQVTEPNIKYIIKYDFNLEGETVEMPEDSILDFDGGEIKNGTIIGNATAVSGKPAMESYGGAFTDLYGVPLDGSLEPLDFTFIKDDCVGSLEFGSQYILSGGCQCVTYWNGYYIYFVAQSNIAYACVMDSNFNPVGITYIGANSHCNSCALVGNDIYVSGSGGGEGFKVSAQDIVANAATDSITAWTTVDALSGCNKLAYDEYSETFLLGDSTGYRICDKHFALIRSLDISLTEAFAPYLTHISGSQQPYYDGHFIYQCCVGTSGSPVIIGVFNVKTQQLVKVQGISGDIGEFEGFMKVGNQLKIGANFDSRIYGLCSLQNQRKNGAKYVDEVDVYVNNTYAEDGKCYGTEANPFRRLSQAFALTTRATLRVYIVGTDKPYYIYRRFYNQTLTLTRSGNVNPTVYTALQMYDSKLIIDRVNIISFKGTTYNAVINLVRSDIVLTRSSITLTGGNVTSGVIFNGTTKAFGYFANTSFTGDDGSEDVVSCTGITMYNARDINITVGANVTMQNISTGVALYSGVVYTCEENVIFIGFTNVTTPISYPSAYSDETRHFIFHIRGSQYVEALIDYLNEYYPDASPGQWIGTVNIVNTSTQYYNVFQYGRGSYQLFYFNNSINFYGDCPLAFTAATRDALLSCDGLPTSESSEYEEEINKKIRYTKAIYTTLRLGYAYACEPFFFVVENNTYKVKRVKDGFTFGKTSGTFLNKPANLKSTDVGYQYFATDKGTGGAGIPIFWNGSSWVDANGDNPESPSA